VDFEIAKLFFDKGASVNAPATPGGVCGCLTPLHLAAEGGSLPLVSFLLEHGAPCDPVTEDRKVTPLYLAIRAGHTEIVETLLQHGADLGLAKEGNLSPLQEACLNGHDKICELLMQKGMVMEPHLNGKPLLHIAVERSSNEKSYVNIITLLCRCGADPNEEWYGPIPSYHQRLEKKMSSKAMLLVVEREKSIAKIADAETKSKLEASERKMNLTPVHMACASGKIGCLRALLAAGGKPDWKSTSNGVTPYDLALENQVKAVLKLLTSGSLGAGVKPHHLEETTFTSPTYCFFCRSFIWGIYKQGWRCKGKSLAPSVILFQ